MTIKIMVSQPMNGLNEEEILEKRNELIELILDCYKDSELDVEIMDTIIKDHEYKKPLQNIAQSITFLSRSDLLVMADGWWRARGCIVEHHIASLYEHPIVHESELRHILTEK